MIETETGEKGQTPTGKEEEEAEVRPPLVRGGMGRLWLPLSLAVICAVALIGGFLIGYDGLFTDEQIVERAAEPAPAPPLTDAGSGAGEAGAATPGPSLYVAWAHRFEALGKLPVLVALWTICALGALAAGAWLFGRPFGDPKLAAARMLGIVLATRCAGYISLPEQRVEFFAEAAAAALVFFLLTMFFFRLRPRDAGTLLGLTLLACIVLYVGAKLMAWAM